MSLKTMKKRIFDRNRSRYYEITEDINCIPKGVYKALSDKDGIYEFTIDSKVFFSVMNNVGQYMRKLPKDLGKQRRTKLEDFIDNYYELLHKNNYPNRSFNPLSPFTVCMIHPTVAREVN